MKLYLIDRSRFSLDAYIAVADKSGVLDDPRSRCLDKRATGIEWLSS